MLKKLNHSELKSFLDEKYKEYNNFKFITTDPIQVPHSFSLKEDIEISAFLTSTISWGNRKVIINNAKKMMLLLDESPYDFILNHTVKDLLIDLSEYWDFEDINQAFFLNEEKLFHEF